MASYGNFSKKSRKVKEGYNEDFDKAGSYDCKNNEDFNLDSWLYFLSYYRYYIDKFAILLGLYIYPFQRFMLRCMARYQNSMIICCRGIGKEIKF